METSLSGRRALVTGAASGIGREIAEAFARAGATVAVHARSDERAAPTVAAIEAGGGRAFAVAADLRRRAVIAAMVEAAIDRLGGLDILVSNAGVFALRTIETLDEPAWDAIIETNLTAPYLLTRAAAPALRASGAADAGTSVIFISSIAADSQSAGWSAYAASKSALNAFMRCMADELGGAGVRVNAIAPGWVDTGMAREGHRAMAKAANADHDAFYAESMRSNKLGALLTPDSIADMAVYLASPSGRFITAQVLTVCGGYPAGRARPARRPAG